jgi:hypothetical protein
MQVKTDRAAELRRGPMHFVADESGFYFMSLVMPPDFGCRSALIFLVASAF